MCHTTDDMNLSRRELLRNTLSLIGASLLTAINTRSRAVFFGETSKSIDTTQEKKALFEQSDGVKEAAPKTIFLKLLTTAEEAITASRNEFTTHVEISMPPKDADAYLDILYVQHVTLRIALEELKKMSADELENITPQELNTLLSTVTYRKFDELVGIQPRFDDESQTYLYPNYSPGYRILKHEPLQIAMAWIDEKKEFEQTSYPEWVGEVIRQLPYSGEIYSLEQAARKAEEEPHFVYAHGPQYKDSSSEYPFIDDVVIIPTGNELVGFNLSAEEVENYNTRIAVHEIAHTLDIWVNVDLKAYLTDSEYAKLAALRSECKHYSKYNFLQLTRFPREGTYMWDQILFNKTTQINHSWLYQTAGYPITNTLRSFRKSTRDQQYKEYSSNLEYTAASGKYDEDDWTNAGLFLIDSLGDMRDMSKMTMIALSCFLQTESELFAEIGLFVLLFKTNAFTGTLLDLEDFYNDPHYKYFTLLLNLLPTPLTQSLQNRVAKIQTVAL